MSESYFEKQFLNKLFITNINGNTECNRPIDRKWKALMYFTKTIIKMDITRYGFAADLEKINRGHFFNGYKLYKLYIDELSPHTIEEIKKS